MSTNDIARVSQFSLLEFNHNDCGMAVHVWYAGLCKSQLCLTTGNETLPIV